MGRVAGRVAGRALSGPSMEASTSTGTGNTIVLLFSAAIPSRVWGGRWIVYNRLA